MIWFILFFVCILLAIVGVWFYSHRSGVKETVGAFIAWVTIITAIVSFVFMCVCLAHITDYPHLLGQKQKIVSLQKRIKSIKDSYYQGKTGTFIGGDIANKDQSSTLSQYIIAVAELEAEYNKGLSQSKLYVQNSFYRWFYAGFFIDKRVLELTPIE
jgi:hypothetical protein